MAVTRRPNEFVINANIDRPDTQTPPDTPFSKPGSGNRRGRIRGKVGENVMNYNFKKVAKFGLLLRWTRMGNEMVGSYTGRRMRQQQIQRSMTMAQYAIGIKVAGPFGAVYAGADMAYRYANRQIEINKQNVKADIMKTRSGNNTRTGTRYAGAKT